eukprot:gene29284-biopygen24672
MMPGYRCAGHGCTTEAPFNTATLTCSTNGHFDHIECQPEDCAPQNVANSDHAAHNSIAGTQGQSVTVSCDLGYTGGGPVECTQGQWISVLQTKPLPFDLCT